MLVDKHHFNQDEKRSLILAGGGMRLAYQAGVLIALEEAGLKFHHVDGTSGGIFNAAMLASGLNPSEIAARWRTLKVKNFVSMRKFRSYLSPFYMEGYTDADNIRDKVFPQLGIDINTINSNENINATFNVCNFTDKTVESISNVKVKLNHLLAGVSLPIVMPALKIDNKWYTDAVWIKDANLLEANRQNSNEIWLIWAIGNNQDYLPGALNQYVHMIEMSANGALLEEYRQIQLKDSAAKKEKSTKLFVIKPEYPLPLDPDLFFNKVDTRSLINMGYSDAKKSLNQFPENGVTMDQDATKMSDPGQRLCFRGVYQGKLNWEENPQKIIFYNYFRFSTLLGKERLELYGSIYIESFDLEIPLFDTQVSKVTEKDVPVMKTVSKFIIKGEVYQLHAVRTLDTPLDILIGVGFKSISINITKSKDLQIEVASGKLFQSISDRLKSSFHTNVRTAEGKPGGLFKKHSMLSKFITYEI